MPNYAVALTGKDEPARVPALLEQSPALAERAKNGELLVIDCGRLAERLAWGEAGRAQGCANQILEFWQRKPELYRGEIAGRLRSLSAIQLEQG